MIEEALTAPISVSMLKIDGKKLMEVCKIEPGPKVGLILHALFEEVLDEPKLNTLQYLEERSFELSKLNTNDLQKLGKEGMERKEQETAKKQDEIKKKHFVA